MTTKPKGPRRQYLVRPVVTPAPAPRKLAEKIVGRFEARCYDEHGRKKRAA